MPVPQARQTIQGQVLAWPEVTQHPHREVVAAGLADWHHVLPESGWISRYRRRPEDVDTAIALFRRSYDLAVAQRSRYAA